MLNPMTLEGRTILVTGASSGIGRETAIVLAALGARVVCVARDQARLEETASQMEGAGHVLQPFDLQNVEAIAPWMKTLAGEVGGLDGLVHSAGLQAVRPLRFLVEREMEEMLRLNVSAAAWLTKGFRQKGVAPRGGGVVYLASVVALAGQAGLAAYSASKGALTAMTRSLAVELAPEKIRVNCVAPAVVQTEMGERLQNSLTKEQFEAIEAMHPLGLGTPRDVAHAIAFLLADSGRWITGSTLVVDGGYLAR